MTAAGSILKAAVFDLGGVIRVTRPGTVGKASIVSGTGVGIVNDGGNRGTAGVAVQNSGEELRPVFFFPGGGPVVLTRGPAVQEGLQSHKVHRKPCGDAVQGHADGRPMGLAENG